MGMLKAMGILVLAGGLPALATELFGSPRGLAGMEWAGGPRWIKRGRAVSIRADRLRRGATVRLELFADAIYDAALDHAELSADGRTVLYTGTLAGTDQGTACFAVTGEAISGAVWAGKGRRFLVRPSDGGIVEEIDEQGFPPLEEALLPGVREWLPANEMPPDDETVTIDVMVVYTPSAATAAGGSDRIENLIELAAAEANLSYAKSGILQRIRIVHKAQIQYDESGGTFRALLQLTDRSDGNMDEVHEWRDLYGADIVSLWTNAADSCGLSWQFTDPNRSFADFAFNVVNQACATANLSFAHELGHNMGAQHDRAHALSPGAFLFSYGYRKPGPNGFRTIMSYGCAETGADCPRLPYWSSPALRFGDFALGEEGDGDKPTENRTTLNATRRIVANWRAAPEDSLSNRGSQ